MMGFYVALGDSITAGYGVGPALAFPAVYTRMLRSYDPSWEVANLGINGLTTYALRKLLQMDPRISRMVCRACLITITIGSNDLLHAFKFRRPPNIPWIQYNLEQIGCMLKRLNPAAVVKVATLYNPLPAGPYAQYAAEAQSFLNEVNDVLITWASRYGFIVAPIDRALCGRERELLLPESLHPNAAGQQVIAETFAFSQ